MIDTSTVTTELATVEDKQELAAASDNRIAELKKDPEIQRLNSEIKLNDISTVNEFGKKPALELSKTADALLAITKDVSRKEMLEVFSPLSKILKRFSIKDFEGKPVKKGLFGKFFAKVADNIDDMFKKYETMGNELNDVVQTLNKYKVDIVKSNGMIQQLQEANVKHFTELENILLQVNSPKKKQKKY